MKRSTLLAAVLLGIVPCAAGAGGPASLVRDLATGILPAPVLGGGSQLASAPFGGHLYFAGSDPLHGTELWRSDGTASGTERVIDLCPGRCSSSPAVFTPIGETLYFVAEDGATGRELWATDGTAAGTRLVRDVARGPESPFIPYFYWGTGQPPPPVAVGETIFFPALDDRNTTQLWRSDGSWAGTEPVTTAFAAEPNPVLWPLAASGGRLLFLATDHDHGRELWTSDGTAEGTHLLRDFCPGECWGDPYVVGATDERVLVAARAAATGPDRLWTIAGAGAPQPFTELCATGCYAARATRLGADLVVSYATDTAVALWRTGLGVRPSVALGSVGVASAQSELTTAGNRVFFAVRTPAREQELWRTDGTAAGTVRVANVDPDGGSYAGLGLAPFGDGVIFTAHTLASGFEPWTSDGTAAGTRPLADLAPGEDSSQPIGFAPLGDRVLFATSIGAGRRELWATDGSSAGTVQLDRERLAPVASEPQELAAWRDDLAFAALGAGGQRRLWRSDGSAAGTGELGLDEIVDPAEPRALGDELFFAGTTRLSGWNKRKLWRTDGTAGGTAIVAGDDGDVHGLTPVGGALFFLGNPPGQVCQWDRCSELYRLAPGATAAELLRDINPHRYYGCCIPEGEFDASSNAHDLTPIAGRLYFGADDGDVGDEPWVSDGTPAGTRRVADAIHAGSHPEYASSHPRGFVGFDPWVLFSTAPGYGSAAPGLWRTDGTEAGTTPLQYASGAPVRLGDRVYFLRTESVALDRAGLWASDGTAAGTVQVSPLALGGEPGYARGLVVAGNRLYFTVAQRTTGEELWTSDGTAAGTRPLEIAPGARSANPQALRAVGDRLLFAATDGSSGLEPWVTDGTPPGTRLVQDLAPGGEASSPADFTPVGDAIFFSAGDREHGRELWRLPRAALSGPVCEPDAHTFCLHDRFAISVRWRVGATDGVGTAIGWSRDTGVFWFFGAANVELLVKVLDGRAVNGAFWYYSGALSDVEYWITARDVATGVTRTYHNPRGNLCGRAEVTAFPDHAAPTSAAEPWSHFAAVSATAGCTAGAEDLCLGEGRYRVAVRFADPRGSGSPTAGHAVPVSDETGFFWFFGPDNIELAVKVLDGSAVNGHVWVYYGALSDVEYALTVTDTLTGAVRTYENPRGRLCGGADTAAF